MKFITVFFLLISFCSISNLANAQTRNLVGLGFSYHKSAIVRMTHENYLPEGSNDLFSTKDLPTSGYSYAVSYGKVISPSVIFFTGIEKIRLGQNFNLTTIDFGNYYSSHQIPSPGTPIYTTKTYDVELKLDYVKVPLTLYWKWMKNRPFGMFTSFSLDLGILTSATLIRDGEKTDYKDNLNSKDISYKFHLGARYDTDNYLFNLGLGLGNSFSDVEEKEKIGATVQNPAHNLFLGYFFSLNRKF